MDLKDTIPGMTSENYKDRFIAEYNQVLIRSRKLKNIIDDYYNNCLKFELKSPISLLEAQYKAMTIYCGVLVMRAKEEHIELSEVKR